MLQYTDVKSIPQTVAALRTQFHKQRLHSVDSRIEQLELLYNGINDNVDEICESLQKDFHRARGETMIQEVFPVLSEIKYVIKRLKGWAKPKSVSPNPFLVFSLASQKVESIPLGTVLIISAFNYPLLLTISPLVGAIAGGNCVVVKQSEQCPNFTETLTRVLSSKLSSDCVSFVNGGVAETTALLSEKFDLIFYTGSKRVGTIVAQAAAKTVTPVVLELGGKSPAVISESLSQKQIEIAAKRVAWARFTNSGQICVAVDYLLVHEKVHDKFLQALEKVIKEEFFVGLGPESPDYTHLVNDSAFARISQLLDTTRGKVVMGNDRDKETRFISPTVVDNVSWEDPLMQDEIFGPVLPVLTYSNFSDAVTGIVEHHDTPLASYVYSSRQNEIDEFLLRVRSGGSVINDGLFHVAAPTVPFGGIGSSGYGGYHGKHSFDVFTHKRPVFKQSWWTEVLYGTRYAPYDTTKTRLLKFCFMPEGDSLRSGLSKWLYVATGLLAVPVALVLKKKYAPENNE